MTILLEPTTEWPYNACKNVPQLGVSREEKRGHVKRNECVRDGRGHVDLPNNVSHASLLMLCQRRVPLEPRRHGMEGEGGGVEVAGGFGVAPRTRLPEESSC